MGEISKRKIELMDQLKNLYESYASVTNEDIKDTVWAFIDRLKYELGTLLRRRGG
jgi:hypothetical protein